MITAADEDAVRKIPAGAWKPGTCQDGGTEDDKDVAEITDLLTRGGELARRPELDRPPRQGRPAGR